MELYNLLGVQENATTDEIKKAYRQLALKYHPDRNPGDEKSEAYFKKITDAYDTLSDPEKRESYNRTYKQGKSEQSRQSSENTNQQKTITPETFLNITKDIEEKVISAGRKNINQQNLYNSLKDLFSSNNIKFLLGHRNDKLNESIIRSALTISKYLTYPYAEQIHIKLAKLAGTNNELIREIQTISKKQKIRSKIATFNYRLLFVVLFIGLAVYIGISSDLSSNESNKPSAKIDNGDLDNSFDKSNGNTTSNLSENEIFEKEREKLLSEGWNEEDLSNGQLPICYNFKPIKGKYDNYLEVQVGGGTDVVIKIMNSQTEKCIRYVYINSGTTYKIKNIPQGTYYLKLAYGKDWFSKVENGQCVGKFLRNAFYEKGDEIIDFNIKDEGDSYSVPSFKLKLDVISRASVNTFSSKKITEEYFNQ